MPSQTQHPLLIESRRIARLGGCMVCEKNGEFRVYRKTPDRPVYLGSRTSPETLRRFVQRLTTVA